MDQIIANLIAYAKMKLELKDADTDYVLNQLLDLCDLETYSATAPNIAEDISATDIINPFIAKMLEKGLIESGEEEYISTKTFAILAMKPSEINDRFFEIYDKNKGKALDWFYDYCVSDDYVKSTAIAKNKCWVAEKSRFGVEITINLSKPEKNNKETAKLRSLAGGYPQCMLCKENVGYRGQGRYRQTLRIVPVTIGGKKWYWQYSPYAYFYQHGIALNSKHTPMTMDDTTLGKLFDFIDFAPVYFIGCNAPLPIVGGSILAHEHFQGGKHDFPMFKCRPRYLFKDDKVKVSILDWYNSVVVLTSKDRKALISEGNRILIAWLKYDDLENDIIACDTEQHNTITPVAKMNGNMYELYIILRNNRCDETYPDGIFHVHPEYQNIKRESIGLIEAMGRFILPARLDRELKIVENVLMGNEKIENTLIHQAMTEELVKEYGTELTQVEASRAVTNKLNLICEDILNNTAVFKNDEKGNAGFIKFLSSLGYEKK